ncbi:glycosyltransferase family 2 protein [Flavobacterium sp. UW10123]|uniref:glycosyltransferase family 2 protein n=1 Tax=Flavobacterium sp. UW10123 TaxID=3230800 RepID=UPI003393D385
MKKYLKKILEFFGIRLILKRKINKTKFKYFQLKNSVFNKTVINQNKNLKSIPIIIISFNQLFYLKQLIDFLKKHDYNNIIIIDNNSTFKPLLEYFDEIESIATIHRLKENYGHLVFWKFKELYDKYSKGYYVVTDADINPISDCPSDFLRYFKKILDGDYKITKVGFSLKIDDIPNSNINKEKIINWESKFWRHCTTDGNFIAGLDTTFALYRPKYKYNETLFLRACRTKYPYIAKHGGWYVDTDNLTDEQKFYLENCNESSSWRINKNGELLKSEYNS